ncbi:MAG: tetratricopeptide repeat protein [Prolixibacteraceae bacterium]|nr:tetratricopeptide repeat protein [Prolixibacteraceae bacterium]MBN2648934.1 tetratricopeptide repeat protein [Prolixibacteraceae bacterium]
MKRVVQKILNNNLLTIALIAVCTLIAYANSFDVPFIFDDEYQIFHIGNNKDLAAYADLSVWTNVNTRPAATFTLALNNALGGENVFGYHLINFMIHLLSGLFLFFFLKQLLKFKTSKLTPIFPLAVALFFVLHPAQTQAVTYVVQRMTSMAGMFSLLALFVYANARYHWLIKQQKGRSAALLALSALAAVLALLSKQSAATLPLLFVLVEWFFVRDANENRGKKWAFTLTTTVLVLYAVVLAVYGLPAETTGISRLQYLATQMTVIPRYLKTMLIPVGLYIDHGVYPVENLLGLNVIAGASFLLALLAVAFYKMRQWPLFSFGIFWIFITLMVESSVIPIRDVMFDHRMYLPLAGFAISAWWLLFHLLKNKTQTKPYVVLLVSVMLCGATLMRNHTWRDITGIWHEVTERYPNHFRGWMSAGRSMAAARNTDYHRIIDYYENALRIKPDNEPLLNDLAVNYLKAGKTSKAINCFEKLENAETEKYRIMANRALGVFSLEQKELEKAERYFLKTLETESTDSTSLHGLSSLYINKQNWMKALEYAEEYLAISKNNTEILFGAGLAAYQLSQYEKANQYFSIVNDKKPKHVDALIYRGNSLIRLKRYNEALSYFDKAYELSQRDDIKRIIERLKTVNS